MSTFINPFIDRGFKILFGKEESKELLIDLLNDLFEGEHFITELSFMNVEMPGECPDSRTAVFDLKCRDQDGTIFIVEVQNASQSYFYERGLYYLCRVICDQDRKGDEWKFKIYPVYGIFFLNFHSGRTASLRTDIVLANRETGCQVSNAMHQIYIEMPLFNKKEADCKTGLDYWLYTLKYMEKLQELPFKGQKALFRRLEELAKIVNLNKKERMEYDECLKVYRDNKNTWDYAIEKGFQEGMEKGHIEGMEKGIAEGKVEGKVEGIAEGKVEGIAEGKTEAIYNIARTMKEKGVNIAMIMEYTGLNEDAISKL